MTFAEKYSECESWREKIILMELFHLTRISKGQWNVTKTAAYFKVSIALVSENLKLARELHLRPELMDCKNRQEALAKLKEIK